MLGSEERGLAKRAIVADSLDVEETSVGLEADLPKRREVLKPLADGEVARAVDGRLGAQRAPFLEVLLDPGVLVVDVQRGDDPVGDHAGAEASRCRLGDPTSKEELNLLGAADVEVLADDLFEEDAAVDRTVEHLGERELGLEDREVVAVIGGTVFGRERMRKPSQPAT